jgi:cysteine desulfurase/selenocysteine lyase
LRHYLEAELEKFDEIKIYGTSNDKAPIISFTFGDIHPHDVATLLDQEGIAVRAGHHCAMPLMEVYGINASLRASLAFYNQADEIDRLIAALEKIKKVFM